MKSYLFRCGVTILQQCTWFLLPSVLSFLHNLLPHVLHTTQYILMLLLALNSNFFQKSKTLTMRRRVFVFTQMSFLMLCISWCGSKFPSGIIFLFLINLLEVQIYWQQFLQVSLTENAVISSLHFTDIYTGYSILNRQLHFFFQYTKNVTVLYCDLSSF
jgi:hypothetical protein